VNLEPLFGLRVRTPRLELRVPTEDELEQLYLVAEAGIHPPEEMPFAVAWTDDLSHDAFVGFHLAGREAWTPDAWSLHLSPFVDGRPVGDQGMRAERFAETRRVLTGSWLGREHQGRGLGTEMRAGVLELAFRGLGAREAVSGALLGNDASARVSEKLGYRHTGWGEESPRGEPVPHKDFLLTADEWRPPFEVEIEGLEPALPLFGL
jgi:RimJ/RimL family protein N-acetyltransferase